ncbi:hypothetical protein NQ314_012155 [Rhamnusium bicolor]|uniref:Uncharacterized protein n=1 Tax=Rhamnusium bicolor TaxID=1586634 RepID=A0AAV8XEL1_9CUCU|nr:hypothetical protein NQ314_012155 [Rhamnusium bicolor]
MLKSMEKFVPSDFYAWMDACFKFNGLLPPKDAKKKLLYWLLMGPHFVVCICVMFCLESLKLIKDISKDIKGTMLSLSVSTLAAVIMFRIVVWVFTRNKLAEIKKIVGRESFNFECFSIIKIQYRRKDVFRTAKEKEGHSKILSYEDIKRFWDTTNVAFSSR